MQRSEWVLGNFYSSEMQDTEILLASLFANTPLCIATVVCPPQLYGGEWLHRAWEFCQRNGTLYHCLATQDGDYEELCIKPQNISAGSYAKYSRAAKRIYFEPCPSNLYQPSWQWSNLIYKCEREKTECVSDNTPGQLTCNDGTTSTDRACYCDYRNGYVASIYALGNPQKLRCYIPSIQSSRCAYIPCRGKKELNSAYECVPVCDPGMYRPDHSLNCVPKTSTSEKVSTFTDVMMYNSTTLSPSSKIVTAIRIDSRRRNARVSSLTFEKSKDKGSSVVVTVFVILAIILIFVSIAVFICMPKTYYIHRLRNCICKICCGKDPPEVEEPYPLPPIFSSRSTLTYRTPGSTPANSPYVTPSQTPKSQRAKFPYMENGSTQYLQVPDALKRSTSVRHNRSDIPSFPHSGMRRLSKSESSLEIPAMAQLLMLKKSSRSTERIAKCRTPKLKQESPLTRDVDNKGNLPETCSTHSLIPGVVQQPDLPGSSKNSPYVIKKQLVYIFQNVNNAIVGDRAKMVINKFSKSTDHSYEEESDEENGEENEESELLCKARENEGNGASLESSDKKTALATLTTIEDAMNSLSDQVSGKYTVEDVQHDGHCVYHCVKKATGCKLSIEEMRNWVANYMEAHCNSFKECLSTQRKHHSDDIDTIWADYLYGVRNNEWGDYLVLVALANICDIKINVISTRTPNDVLAIKPSSNPRYSIHLGHLTDLSTDRDLHFVILRKQDSE